MKNVVALIAVLAFGAWTMACGDAGVGQADVPNQKFDITCRNGGQVTLNEVDVTNAYVSNGATFFSKNGKHMRSTDGCTITQK